MADSYNLVGFQNHLRFPEQKRVFRLIPGLEHAEFLRYGQIHRNTFINAPALLRGTLQSKSNPRLLFAGQICGVEGYVESIATGLIAGVNASRLAHGSTPAEAPRDTACGSLLHYIAHADPAGFQPANISFGLLPEPSAASKQRCPDRRLRHEAQVTEALETMRRWASTAGVRELFMEAGG
jgi:methylenetetrahydrofolate--tRNA-(uracil-5-)-methyltransferase